MNATIIRTDGSKEQHELPAGSKSFPTIARLIGADVLDVVNLRDGRLMLVDDDGYDIELVEREPPPGYSFAAERVPVRARKPVNDKATALYHAICRAGTTHQIVGDVAIIDDEKEDEE